MYDDYGYFEEEQLGRTYDARNLMRLYPFSRPYRGLLALSILLVVVITLFELAIPYVTKIAIDRYIVPQPESVQTIGTGSSKNRKRYYKVDLTDANLNRIANKYPDLFEKTASVVRIVYDDLPKLDKNDLYVLRKKDRTGIGYMAIIFIVVILGNYIFAFIQAMTMEYVGQKMMHDLRMQLYTHIQGLSIAFFTRNPVGRLVTRVTNDIQNMNELFTSIVTFIFKDIFLLTGIAAVLISINWRLALVSFAVIPFVVVFSIIFSVRARDIFRVLRIKIAQINTKLSETISGMRVIQLFNQQQVNYRIFQNLNHDNYLANMRQVRIFALFMPVIELLGVVAISVVIYYGGGRVLFGGLSLGALVAFLSYMKMFFQPIRDISEKYHIIQNAMASAERIFLLLDTKEKTTRPDNRPKSGSLFENISIDTILKIEFQDVCFGYAENEGVLHGISLSIRSGEKIAIVGPTGSGKTTLINLITRFYDPISGKILINGSNIKKMDPTILRSKLAVVMQEPFLFSETIRKNIFLGKKDVSNEKLAYILSASNLTELMEKMPSGPDTVLSEAAASISSGERQLISIARAFAHDPELIIFDEATSYIDSATEQKIQSALFNLMEKRTAILVAHRLSTARRADRIIVLNRGRIIETGPHNQLMKQQGFYYRLSQLQNNRGNDSK
ncbi:ABC transporter ATP-binding protein [Thermodesulfobacteriota bacterium]